MTYITFRPKQPAVVADAERELVRVLLQGSHAAADYWDKVIKDLTHADRSADADAEAYAKKV